MTAVTANMIKELRDRTGIGMGKCKEALEESKGDMDLAIANLRKAGLASAVKKEGRATNEGMIGAFETDKGIGIVEVAAETDFVVQNDRFQQFVLDLAKELATAQSPNLESFLKHSKDGSTIDEIRSALIQAIGENIQIKRILSVKKDADKSYGLYSHLGGKILTLVVISGANTEAELARGIALHTAAAAPEYLSPESVPASILENERDIARAQMKGKPDNIIEKIVSGKLNSFYDESCLIRQKYIRDDSKTITQVVEARSKEIGKPLAIASFIRWSK